MSNVLAHGRNHDGLVQDVTKGRIARNDGILLEMTIRRSAVMKASKTDSTALYFSRLVPMCEAGERHLFGFSLIIPRHKQMPLKIDILSESILMRADSLAMVSAICCARSDGVLLSNGPV